MFILSGDVGGTKTHLSLVDANNPKIKIIDKKYPSQHFKNFSDIIIDFIHDKKEIVRACFGIAGPIKNNRCQTTNLPWNIDASDLCKILKTTEVHLINDLEATAWGIPWLNSTDIEYLNKGVLQQDSNMALIAAGTGLGEAGLFWNGDRHIPFACEGGHVDFAATNEELWDLRTFLSLKYGHVSYERILSGPGLINIYEFLIKTGRYAKSKNDLLEINHEMQAQVIAENALHNGCITCKHVLDIFVYIYGQAAGNLALKFFSLSGLYIGGGIAPKILELMKTPLFMEGFTDKGRFRKLLEQVPVKLIKNQDTALLGATRYAAKRSQS
ncbi:MAG: glucokinase [Chlamydiae bacterium]|nr:glucokinase [Chlamydiota bacterium]